MQVVTVTLNPSLPWMIVGDFNIVSCQNEKLGDRPTTFSDVSDFNYMISNIGLTDGGFFGEKIHWCNNRIGKEKILERIDRDLLSNLWINHIITNITHLLRHCSDHSPLLIQIGHLWGVGSSFKFINA